MKPTARVTTRLVSLAGLVAMSLAAPGSPASAKLAPTLTITAGDPSVPVRVPFPTEDPSLAALGYTVEVAGGPATNVTVSVSGTGLTTPPPQNLGTVTTKVLGTAAVSATTGGFHQLTFTVTADGAAPSATTLNYVWAPTGAMTVSAGADLQGTYFGVTGTYSENGTSYADRSMLLFLTQELAYYGVPSAGLPTCKTGSTTATAGCLTYAYDPTSQLIQVGGSIGKVDEYGVHTIGLGITDVQGGDDFAHRYWTTQLSFPKANSRYRGRWIWQDSWFCPGVMGGCHEIVALTLRKDGTFALTDNWRKKRTIKGRYHLRRSGRMVLRGKFGKRGKEIHTFSVLLSKAGKPKPKLGVALSYGKGPHADLFFLEPKKK